MELREPSAEDRVLMGLAVLYSAYHQIRAAASVSVHARAQFEGFMRAVREFLIGYTGEALWRVVPEEEVVEYLRLHVENISTSGVAPRPTEVRTATNTAQFRKMRRDVVREALTESWSTVDRISTITGTPYKSASRLLNDLCRQGEVESAARGGGIFVYRKVVLSARSVPSDPVSPGDGSTPPAG